MFKRCTLVLWLLSSQALAQYSTNDLRPRWMKYSDGQYFPYDYADAIHFRLEETDQRDTLVIMGKGFHVFVNNQWLCKGEGEGEIKFPVEKLIKQFPSPTMISIFSPDNVVHTFLRHPLLLNKAEERIMPTQKRFVQLAFLILTAIFAIILNINRTYGANLLLAPGFYFGETVPVGHISSPLNIIYTLFGVLVWGFILSTNQLKLPFLTYFQSVEGQFLYGIAFSAILFLAVCLKIAFTALLAWVYNISGSIGMQSYQLNRLWVAMGIVLCVFWVSYVLLSGKAFLPPFFKYIIILFLLAGYWFIFLVMAKLKNSKSTFQLFSYFCASEILPFLIFIKVLLF